MIEYLAAWLASLSFAAASIVLILAMKYDGRPPFKYGLGLMVLGGVADIVFMVAVTVRLGAFPIINPWIGASFLSLLLTVFALAVWLRHRQPAFLVGVAPIAAAFDAMAALRPVGHNDLEMFAARLSALWPDIPDAGHLILGSFWFPVHITLALAAYALFALAATMGLLHLTLIRALKKKRIASMKYLPPLPVVEHVGNRSVMFGMAALLAALIIGAWGARNVLQSHWLGDPKEVAGVAILAIYAIIEIGRAMSAWSGRRTALAHVGAFVFVLAVFLGSSLWAPKLHGF
jgi:ABC-type uncharacterized transport system permease subunit